MPAGLPAPQTRDTRAKAAGIGSLERINELIEKTKHLSAIHALPHEGWLAYGAALNEGRGMFPSDELFGEWVAKLVNDKLSVTPNLHERAAAMWAAANPPDFHPLK